MNHSYVEAFLALRLFAMSSSVWRRDRRQGLNNSIISRP